MCLCITLLWMMRINNVYKVLAFHKVIWLKKCCRTLFSWHLFQSRHQNDLLASAERSFQMTICMCFHQTLAESIPAMHKMKENKKKMHFIRWSILFFPLNKMSWEEAENFYDSVMAKIWCSSAHKSKSPELQKLQFWREQLRAREMSSFL